MTNHATLLLGLLLLTGCAMSMSLASPQATPAPEPTISSNRPSFSDSASRVPANQVQVETGFTFTKRNRSGTATERHALPEVLVRYRLLEGRTVQPDARLGFGLNDEADDFLTGVGISFLF